MKRFVSVLTVLLLCSALVLPAAAAEGSFVPSISYKPGPRASEVVLIHPDGTRESLDSCVVVTSIEEAEAKSTDITQEERDLLLDVYKKLSEGEMTLPLEENYVIRELVDISFKYNACRAQEAHGRKDLKLKEEGVVLSVTFDLKLNKNVVPEVLTYIDEQWVPAEEVINNEDGSITCVFEDVCPVVFAVKETEGSSPYTGDTAGRNLGLWIGLMGASAVAMAAVVVLGRKRRQ